MAWIHKLKKSVQWNNKCIVFEISETSMLSSPKETRLFVQALTKLNCPYAICDIGLEAEFCDYLPKLGVKYGKISNRLISNVATSEQDLKAVRAIIETARINNIETIADSVNDAATVSKLWQCGVGFIQGQYVQSPAQTLEYDFSQAS